MKPWFKLPLNPGEVAVYPLKRQSQRYQKPFREWGEKKPLYEPYSEFEVKK